MFPFSPYQSAPLHPHIYLIHSDVTFDSPTGPIIRISPNAIHVADPNFHNTLYDPCGRWNKDSFTYTPFGLGDNPMRTLDHFEHHRRRSVWNEYFTPTAIANFQSVLNHHIDKLSKRIALHGESGARMNIGVAYSAMTMDIITDITTGRSIGCLDAEDFNEGVVTLFAGFGPVWRVTKHVPWMMNVIDVVPRWMVWILGTKARQYWELREVSGIYEARLIQGMEISSPPLMMVARNLSKSSSIPCLFLVAFLSWAKCA